MFGHRIVGSCFIPGNLDGDSYLHLLENYIDPMTTQLFEDDNDLLEHKLFFRRDDAPLPFTVPVRQFLNNFPRRWIGRRVAIPVTASDLFTWSNLNSKIFATQPESLEDVRQRIVRECRLLTPNVFRINCEAFENRLYPLWKSTDIILNNTYDNLNSILRVFTF